MAFEYYRLRDADEEEPMQRITAAKDLYLTGDKERAVGAGPDAAFLLVRQGRDVPPEYVNLVTPKGNPRRGRPATKNYTEGEDK